MFKNFQFVYHKTPTVNVQLLNDRHELKSISGYYGPVRTQPNYSNESLNHARLRWTQKDLNPQIILCILSSSFKLLKDHKSLLNIQCRKACATWTARKKKEASAKGSAPADKGQTTQTIFIQKSGEKHLLLFVYYVCVC